MRKKTLITRLIFTGIVLVMFALAALYLYQRQKMRINFLSFQLDDTSQTFIVPDIDRLVDKLNSVDDLEMQDWNIDLQNGLNAALERKNFSYNRELSDECFISFNSNTFVIVFKTSTSLGSLSQVFNEEFETDISSSSDQLTINGVSYNARHFGNYLAISNVEIDPKESEVELMYGNADYVVFGSGDNKGTRHILSEKYHFKLWEELDKEIKGRAVDHSAYVASAPADFDELVFYGSTRISEDVNQFFFEPSQESFDWLQEGVLYIRKDSNEILIAVQGDSRDFGLMLEEQTIAAQNDTAELNYFNIGNFKVLPFETDYNWTAAIPNLQEDLKYYTEFDNFNVLSNSIPSMRWYLGQVQLGNLVQNNQVVKSTYTDCLPERAHFIRMYRDEMAGYNCQSRIYQKDSVCLYSEVTSSQIQVQMEGVDVVHDFVIDIIPSKITAVNQGEELLLMLNNLNEVTLYDTEGNKEWGLSLSTSLVESPQVVDFENDGLFEYVFFQQDQIDVVNNKGRSLKGFPVKLNGSCEAGLCVNYDNSYKHRLLVNVNNTVKVYSEEGQSVDGWMFQGMQAGIRGKIYHVITKGKDIITFKDNNNFQHVLNRRGEYRLDHDVVFSLPSETDFVVGSLESALRKMGYKNGYIYNYYILDGQKDSVKIDQQVAPIRTYWEYNSGEPLLIVEEPGRLLIVNQFGYVQSEVLKPNVSNTEFVGLVGTKDYGFVFADNSQNTIYLLNNYGKMKLPQAVEGSAVSIIEEGLLFTFSGINIKAYKIAEQL